MEEGWQNSRLEMWRTLRWLLVTVAVIAGVHFLVVRPIERLFTRGSSLITGSLERALGAITRSDTRVVEGRAEVIGRAEVAELALLEMRMSTSRTIEKTERYAFFPLGTKKLTFRGVYRVKAGYVLTDGISLRVENGVPVARFPKPEVLSVELVDLEVIHEDSGWLNRIQSGDREQITRELSSQMRREAAASGMLENVEAMLRTRLRDLLGVESVTVEPMMP
jgi:hypothetical protein